MKRAVTLVALFLALLVFAVGSRGQANAGDSLSPRALKEGVLEALSVYVLQSERIESAINEIDESLDPGLWTDAEHLDKRRGKKVFDHARNAVKGLSRLLGDPNSQVTNEALSAAETAAQDLVEADRSLALILLTETGENTAADPGRQQKVDGRLTKGWDALAKGDSHRDSGRPHSAIRSYRKAWQLAARAETLVAEIPSGSPGGEQARATVGESVLVDPGDEFHTTTPQGFGDRQNIVAWSMKWWEKTGKLYAGTNRAWMCWSYAAFATNFPFLSDIYPPQDPDVECTEDFLDLPLQAEIWAVDPESETWEMVYRSPKDVPIVGTDKFAARDLGYRTMAIFQEVDGPNGTTEALYVPATSAKPIHLDKDTVAPPVILRSVDGINFEPIPQDPGTVLGELPDAGFRSMMPYNGKLGVIHSSVQGNGEIYESATPWEGNDAWRLVGSEEDDLRFFELQPFNGYLYAGAFNPAGGYSVLKIDATGEPPYTFTTVVPSGGYLPEKPSKAVVSMHVFDGNLYVGTDNPAELLRIHPNDTWDLIVGTPRDTPDGRKEPLSGLDDGFNYELNDHIWRMQEHEGKLYVGTYDKSTSQRLCADVAPIIGPFMGFDLYESEDGIHFSAISLDGFGDLFDYGIRTFQSTPAGLFFGTSNYNYGTNIYRGAGPSPGFGPMRPPGVALAGFHPCQATVLNFKSCNRQVPGFWHAQHAGESAT